MLKENAISLWIQIQFTAHYNSKMKSIALQKKLFAFELGIFLYFLYNALVIRDLFEDSFVYL